LLCLGLPVSALYQSNRHQIPVFPAKGIKSGHFLSIIIITTDPPRATILLSPSLEVAVLKMSFSLRYVAFGIASLVQLAHGTASTISYETCTTGFGKISVYPVPSTTYALTLTFHPTAYSTLTPIITATPSPLTVRQSQLYLYLPPPLSLTSWQVGTTLFTTTTIIEPVVTDTFSSTSTKIDTATVQGT